MKCDRARTLRRMSKFSLRRSERMKFSLRRA